MPVKTPTILRVIAATIGLLFVGRIYWYIWDRHVYKAFMLDIVGGKGLWLADISLTAFTIVISAAMSLLLAAFYSWSDLILSFSPSKSKFRACTLVPLGMCSGVAVAALGLVRPFSIGRSAAALLLPTAWLAIGNPLVIILFAVVLPMTSELFFRGVLMRTLRRSVGVVLSIIVSALAFTWLCPVLGYTLTFILALVAGALYAVSGSLLPGCLASGCAIVSSAAWILRIDLNDPHWARNVQCAAKVVQGIRLLI